jgi:hypothetical protein
MMHVVSVTLASSWAVRSGYIVFKLRMARRDSITSLHDLRNALNNRRKYNQVELEMSRCRSLIYLMAMNIGRMANNGKV